MTFEVRNYNDGMVVFTNAEGVKIIEKKAELNGYKIKKIEQGEDRWEYIVTMEKIKQLKRHDAFSETE